MSGYDCQPEIARRACRIDQEAGSQHQIEDRQRKQNRAQDHMHENLPVSPFFTM